MFFFSGKWLQMFDEVLPAVEIMAIVALPQPLKVRGKMNSWLVQLLLKNAEINSRTIG